MAQNSPLINTFQKFQAQLGELIQLFHNAKVQPD